ncbi:UvrB/UvrC motif-containing protein, partial [candidate division WOR-3 bacterium]|nr:UvrB/UvrC motif-containing protein [candidate division WOR-3 bacterium]
EVIMYADNITGSMMKTIEETERRRRAQLEYNRKHNITPETIYKTKEEILRSTSIADTRIKEKGEVYEILEGIEGMEMISKLTKIMGKLADEENFEEAIKVRDRIRKLQSMARKKARGEYEIKRTGRKNKPTTTGR